MDEDIVLENLDSIESEWSEEPDTMCTKLQQLYVESSRSVADVPSGVARDAQSAAHTTSRLESYSNMVCAINRLPVETMRAIFELSSGCGVYASVNIAITHVCSYWRTVALGNPQAWTCFDVETMTKAYAKAAESRSKGLPLYFVSFSEAARNQHHRYDRKAMPTTPGWIIAFIVDNLYRIKVLHIRPKLDNLSYSQLLWTAAPILEELVFQVDVHADLALVLVNGVLGQFPPTLRKLSLHGFRFPWTPVSYKNLTTLEIDARLCPLLPTESVELVCRESPDLETLRLSLGVEPLEADLPMPPPVREDDVRRIIMPRLRHINLEMRVERVASILSAIRLTKQPEEFAIIVHTSRGDRFEALFGPRYLPTLLFQRLGILRIENDPDDLLRLRGSAIDYIKRGPRDHQWALRWLDSGAPNITPCDFAIVAAAICSASGTDSTSLTKFVVKDFVGTGALTVVNHFEGAAALLLHHSRSITSFTVHSWRCPGHSSPGPTSRTFKTLFDCIHAAANAPPPLLPQLSKCRFTVDTSLMDPDHHPIDDFMHIAPLIQLLNRDIRRLHISGAGYLAMTSSEQARECVRAFRALGIPEVYWDLLCFWDSSQTPYDAGGYPPHAVWPEGEEYVWKCGIKEATGRHSTYGCCSMEERSDD